MTEELEESEAEEVVETVNEADLEDANNPQEAAEIVEKEASPGLTEAQIETAKTVAAAGVVASSAAVAPAGITLSAPAIAYIAMESDSIVGAYRDGYDQLKEIGDDLFGE